MRKTDTIIGLLYLREPPEDYPRTVAHLMKQYLFEAWDKEENIAETRPHISGLLAHLAWLLCDKQIEDRHVKKIFEDAWNTEPEYWSLVGYLADTEVLEEADGDDLKDIVLKVLEANEKAREDIKKGKKKAIGHLIGQVMKAAQGKANPQQAKELIEELV